MKMRNKLGIVAFGLVGGIALPLMLSAQSSPQWEIAVRPSANGVEVQCISGCGFETLSAACDADSDCFLRISNWGVSGAEPFDLEGSVID